MLIKRIFDLIFSIIGLFFLSWLIFLAWFLASIDTRSNGFFFQQRVGKDGKLFKIIKIKTMIPSDQVSTITTSKDTRITRLGSFWRKTKIDELPQLINVLLGQMSFVGPRPDVPGYADRLNGKAKIILSVRPGITGPGSLAFRNEEEILACQENPKQYNDEIIYPEKIRLNIEYIENWSLFQDVKYIYQTIFG